MRQTSMYGELSSLPAFIYVCSTSLWTTCLWTTCSCLVEMGLSVPYIGAQPMELLAQPLPQAPPVPQQPQQQPQQQQVN